MSAIALKWDNSTHLNDAFNKSACQTWPIFMSVNMILHILLKHWVLSVPWMCECAGLTRGSTCKAPNASAVNGKILMWWEPLHLSLGHLETMRWSRVCRGYTVGTQTLFSMSTVLLVINPDVLYLWTGLDLRISLRFAFREPMPISGLEVPCKIKSLFHLLARQEEWRTETLT